MNASIQASDRVQTQSTLTQGISIAIAIFVAILVAFTLGKAIRRPLKELLRVLTEVTQGDMTQRSASRARTNSASSPARSTC